MGILSGCAGGLLLDTSTYVNLTRRLSELAETVCEGRLVSVLEGGYNTSALADCAVNHVEALARSQPHKRAGAPAKPDPAAPEHPEFVSLHTPQPELPALLPALLPASNFQMTRPPSDLEVPTYF